jgi:hypothetical protein
MADAQLKRQWDDTLDGREVAVFDIAPKIHMLSSVFPDL